MPVLLALDHRPAVLLDRLADFLGATDGASDPFAGDVIVCGNGGFGIRQAMADRLGVASGLELLLPGRFLWRVIAQLLDGVSASSPFEPEALRWVILPQLVELADDPDIEPGRLAVLHSRFEAPGRTSDPAMLILASQIAQQYSHLLNFRRDWLDAWAAGKPAAGQGDAEFRRHEAWLSWLWQQTLQRLPRAARQHPFERFTQWFEKTSDGVRRSRIQALGLRRVAVFGMPSMAPEQLQLLGRLAAVLELGFFVPDPCREFWQDLVSPQRLAAVRLSNPDQAWLFEHDPSVLAAWGRQHRDYLTQLRNLEEQWAGQLPVRVDESFRDLPMTPPANGLQALQQSLLSLSNQPWLELPAGSDPVMDRSLQIHACHGRTRQLEVLRDLLLDCFEGLPDLQPDQVLVLVPRLDEFVEGIDGVFGDDRLPYAIEGRPRDAGALASSFARLLDAAAQGLDLAMLRTLFDDAPIREAVGLDEDESRLLLELLQRAGFREDLAGAPSKHGLREAIDRLLLGLSLACDFDDPPLRLADLIAIPGLGLGSIELLGRLEEMLAGLARLAEADRQRPDLAQWCELAAIEISRWFGNSPVPRDTEGMGRPRADRLEAQRVDLLDLVRTIAEQPRAVRELTDDAEPFAESRLDLPAFARVFADAIQHSRSATRVRNAVTFGSVESLRGQPARVLVWLGLSESAFPRQRSRLEFDLMARAPRFGDVDVTALDRGVFLDSIVGCADRLLILYDGRDLRSNEPLNPSILVDELIAYVQAQPTGKALAIVEHPLLACSPEVFRDPHWPAFDSAAFRAARVLAREATLNPGEPGMASTAPATSAGMPEPRFDAPRVESQTECLSTLSRPAQAYLRRTVGLEWPGGLDELGEAAPLDPVGDLAGDFRQLAQRLLDSYLEASSGPRSAKPSERERSTDTLWSALPELPSGAFGEVAARRFSELLSDRLIRTASLFGTDASTLEGWTWQRRHATLGSRTLETAMIRTGAPAASASAASDACFQVLWSAFPIGARSVIDAWLRHQVARLLSPAAEIVTVWVGDGKDQFRIHSPAQDSASGAPECLEWAFDQADRALVAAPLLLPRTYLAWVRRADAKERAAGFHEWEPNTSARQAVETEFRREVEADDCRILFQAQPPTLEQAMLAAAPVYGPLFEAVAK